MSTPASVKPVIACGGFATSTCAMARYIARCLSVRNFTLRNEPALAGFGELPPALAGGRAEIYSFLGAGFSRRSGGKHAAARVEAREARLKPAHKTWML